MAMLKPPRPERKERKPMKQSDFYLGIALAMVGGMFAIAIALGFNAYATWTAVECTTVYFTAEGPTSSDVIGRFSHTCFDRTGHRVGLPSLPELDPRTPPLGE